MSLRRIVLGCAVAAVAAASPSPATAVAPGPDPAPAPDARIAPGVTAGGVDLSGLTVSEAALRLHRALDLHLARPVAFAVRGRTFRLGMAAAAFALDAEATARQAVASPAPATAPGAGGAVAGTDIPLVVTHSTTAVRAFVTQVARQVRSAARNATLRITVRRIVVRRSRYGLRLDQVTAYRRINAVLADASASRRLGQRLSRVRAAVNTNDLARRYATVITVQKSTRTLRLFKGLKVSRRYPVAIGQPAYPTPQGLFSIQSKQVNPTWSVPNSPWAGELAGSTVQGGSAANPLKARWMGITDGVGIHGTGDDASIGTAASHGCLRMHVRDVVALYPRVPLGTPVLIAA